jgi:hypothetical protein
MAVFNTPPIDRLLTLLQVTQLQSRDPALFQVIDLIIKWMRQFQIQVTGTSGGGGGGGGGGGLVNATYITYTDQTALLPNSKQLIAGDNVTLTIVGDTLVVSATPVQSVTNINNFLNEFYEARLDLKQGRRNGRTSIYRRFTNEQVGAPVIMVEKPGRDSDMSLVVFSADIVSTRTMHVYWQAPNGAPSQVDVTYLIGEANGSN